MRCTRLPAVVRWLGIDLVNAVRHLHVNVVAGSPLLPRPVRWWLYRLAGVHTATMNIFPGLEITGPAFGRARLEIGALTFVNRRCRINLLGDVTIGSHVKIASDVLIETATHGRGVDGIDDLATARPIIIGDRAWIGARALIGPGAVVGEDVIVAAGAVVTGTLSSGGVYGGVPARRIGNVTVDA